MHVAHSLPVAGGAGQPSSSRTSGMTCFPNSSMLRIIFSCGSGPALYFMANRETPSNLTVAAILRATVCGEPTRASLDRLLVEMRPRHWAPTPFRTDPVVHLLEVRPQLVAGLLVGVGDIAGRMHCDRKHRLAELGE